MRVQYYQACQELEITERHALLSLTRIERWINGAWELASSTALQYEVWDYEN